MQDIHALNNANKLSDCPKIYPIEMPKTLVSSRFSQRVFQKGFQAQCLICIFPVFTLSCG